jgi:hypothetical protein
MNTELHDEHVVEWLWWSVEDVNEDYVGTTYIGIPHHDDDLDDQRRQYGLT